MKNAEKFIARCEARKDQVILDDDGTINVPSIALEPNTSVAAWAKFLEISLVDSKMRIIGNSCPFYVKYPGHTTVTAHG